MVMKAKQLLSTDLNTPYFQPQEFQWFWDAAAAAPTKRLGWHS